MPRITRAASRRLKASVTDIEQPEASSLSSSTATVAKDTDVGHYNVRPALEELNQNYSHSNNSFIPPLSDSTLVSTYPTPRLDEGATENIEENGKSNCISGQYQGLTGSFIGDTMSVNDGAQTDGGHQINPRKTGGNSSRKPIVQQRELRAENPPPKSSGLTTDISSPTMGEYKGSSISQGAQLVRPAGMQLNIPKPRTPKFDPEVHKSPTMEVAVDGSESEDSFVQSIITRSPPKPNGNSKSSDGIHFANISRQRTSAPSFSHTQDPLDAIDALEDALEQIGQALPVVDDGGLDSPVRAGTPIEATMPQKLPMPRTRTNDSHSRHIKPKPVAQASSRSRDHDARLQRSKSMSTLKERNATRPKGQDMNSSRIRSKQSANNRSSSRIIDPSPRIAELSKKTSQSALSSDAGATSASNSRTRPRPASVHLGTPRPGFTPSKSVKPPTRPTFELPGEARSKRLKAEREERLKREAEEEQRRREFKARELRHNVVPSIPVKGIVASRSRGNGRSEDVSSSQPHVASLTTNRDQANIHATTRTNSLRVASNGRATSKRSLPNLKSGGGSPSISPNAAISPLDSQLRRSVSFHTSPSPSRRGEQSPSTSRANTAAFKARGKDIYERDQLYKQERDRERRQKEEAAARARREAAERGRLASREWAEKQRLKAVMSKRSLNDVRGEKQAQSKQTPSLTAEIRR